MSTDLDRLIVRHDRYLTRVNRMLDAHDRGEGFPVGTEFHEDELKSMDSECRDILIQLLGTLPEDGDWVAPSRYAFVNGYGKPGPMTWLIALRDGLTRSKDYLNSISKPENPRSKIEDHTGSTTAQVVVQGGASTGDITVTGGAVRINDPEIDLGKLVDELSRLRAALKRETDSTDTANDIDIGKMAAAQEAAQRRDMEGVKYNLGHLSPRVLRIAEKIGVSTIVELLKAWIC